MDAAEWQAAGPASPSLKSSGAYAMKQLVEPMAAQWCRSRGLRLTTAGNVEYEESDYLSIEVKTPVEAIRRLSLAYSLLMAGVPDDDESQYAGGLLRITDFDIWSSTFERVGHRLLTALGIEIRDTATPTLLFAKGEIVDAQAAAAIPIVFGWDAYLVSALGETLIFISHDGPVQINCRTRVWFEQLFERLETGEWKPSERLRRKVL
jgi:hypothetical protein